MNVALRNQIKKLCKENPEEVIKILLETNFWPKELAVNTHYKRFDDDTYLGHISVLFSEDADAWLEVLSQKDEDDPFTHRFRTPFMGGGQSGRVRIALLILALAIKLDNKEHPQDRPPRENTPDS